MPEMSGRRGFLLMTLVLLISTLALTATLGVLERDTRLKRFQERELKSNLDALRRAVDLYRFKYTKTAPDSAKIANLETLLTNGPATAVVELLANQAGSDSFLRARSASGSLNLKLVRNLVLNGSFEFDDGTLPRHVVEDWTGNFTVDDGVPDCWQLTSDGIEQEIASLSLVAPATYVASFWARAASPTARVRFQVWPDVGPFPLLEITAESGTWKRFSGHFVLPSLQNLRVKVIQAGLNSGDAAFADGVMLEKWSPPADAPADLKPVPSAWTEQVTFVPDVASQTLEQGLLEDLIPSDASLASLSWWLEW